jgi:hypothetical protein
MLAQSQLRRDFADPGLRRKVKKGMEAFDPFERAAGIRCFEAAGKVLAGARAEVEGKRHERDLLRRETSVEPCREACRISRHLSSPSALKFTNLFMNVYRKVR